jgi:hypothetical protein
LAYVIETRTRNVTLALFKSHAEIQIHVHWFLNSLHLNQPLPIFDNPTHFLYHHNSEPLIATTSSGRCNLLGDRRPHIPPFILVLDPVPLASSCLTSIPSITRQTSPFPNITIRHHNPVLRLSTFLLCHPIIIISTRCHQMQLQPFRAMICSSCSMSHSSLWHPVRSDFTG